MKLLILSLLWLTLNTNVFSLQDDYIKTTEDVRSDESKWREINSIFYNSFFKKSVLCAVDKFGRFVCLDSLQIAEAICKDVNYLNAQFCREGNKSYKMSQSRTSEAKWCCLHFQLRRETIKPLSFSPAFFPLPNSGSCLRSTGVKRAPGPGVTPLAPQEGRNKSCESGNERASRQSDPLAGKALSVIAFVAEGSAQNSHQAPFSSTRPRVSPPGNQLLLEEKKQTAQHVSHHSSTWLGLERTCFSTSQFFLAFNFVLR